MSVISRVGDFCILRFYLCIYRYGSSPSVYILTAVSQTISFNYFIFIVFSTHKQEHKRQSEVSLHTQLNWQPHYSLLQACPTLTQERTQLCRLSGSLTGWISGLSVSWMAETRSERDRRSITTKLSSKTKQFLPCTNCLVLFHHDPNKRHDPKK